MPNRERATFYDYLVAHLGSKLKILGIGKSSVSRRFITLHAQMTKRSFSIAMDIFSFIFHCTHM